MAIYLDYAATAVLRPEIGDLLQRLTHESLGNASSLHRWGRNARMHLETARETCAQLLKAQVEEIVFCSGATEADNLALWGVTRLADQPHLLISAVEHPAVAAYADFLAQSGVEVERIPVDDQGRVCVETLTAQLRPNTCLVSVMAANNEVGTRQPIAEIVTALADHPALLHVDAAQQTLTGDCGADLISYSGHKLGGLPGGLLYVRKGVSLAPMLLGGSQEDSRRAGTSNVIAAVAMAEVLRLALADDQTRIQSLRARLEERLVAVPGARLLAGEAERAPHISAWLFAGLVAEPLLARLDLAGLAASSGSACSSHSIEPSKVLLAMGFNEREAAGLIRLSLGWKTSQEDVDQAAELITQAVSEIREKVVKV